MPNWCYNTIVIQGKKDALHKLIKIGLENSGLASTDDIEKDFVRLRDGGKHKAVNKKGDIVLEDGLTARTFTPMPDVFFCDTYNFPDKYPNELKEQKEKYGIVGWYDYNCETLGTKWDFTIGKMEDEEYFPKFEELKTRCICRITFDCDTAWSAPIEWMKAIRRLVPELFICIMCHEEMGNFYYTAYIDENFDDVDFSDRTDEFDAMCDKFNEEREEMDKKIRADKKRMTALRKEVKSENPKMTPDEVEDEINSRIEAIIDEEVGDCVDELEILDELDDDFCQMRDTFM